MLTAAMKRCRHRAPPGAQQLHLDRRLRVSESRGFVRSPVLMRAREGVRLAIATEWRLLSELSLKVQVLDESIVRYDVWGDAYADAAQLLERMVGQLPNLSS